MLCELIVCILASACQRASGNHRITFISLRSCLSLWLLLRISLLNVNPLSDLVVTEPRTEAFKGEEVELFRRNITGERLSSAKEEIHELASAADII